MTISTRITPISRDILFRPGFGLSPAEISAQIASFARDQIAAIDASNSVLAGHAVEHETFVDGAPSNDLAKVRPDGTIVATWELVSDVVQYCWDQVIAHSPVLTGEFKKSQRIYADGVEVDGPEGAQGADEVVIASTVPYARKIEGIGRKIEGIGQKKGESSQAPQGVYEVVAGMASSRYGNIASIKFSAREIIDGNTSLQQWAARHSSKAETPRKQAAQRTRDARQPCIVIRLR